MHFEYTKARVSGVWVVAMLAVAASAHLAGPSSWTVLALLTLIPPTILWQLWNAPVPSMSESIPKTVR